jgi:hypothetical protein
MRLAVLLVVVLGGCGAGRPAVIHKLSELPADSGRRDAVLDAGHVTNGPELQGQPKLKAPERKAATGAAFAAAIIGSMLSTTENVTLGGASTIEETDLVMPARPAPPPVVVDANAEAKDKAEASKTRPPPATDLVPWVKLK